MSPAGAEPAAWRHQLKPLRKGTHFDLREGGMLASRAARISARVYLRRVRGGGGVGVDASGAELRKQKYVSSIHATRAV